MNQDKKRAEVWEWFERKAKQFFGESASIKWSDNDNNVIEIHTAQTSADVKAIERFANGNLQCWVTTNASHEIIVCREITPSNPDYAPEW